MIAEILVVAFSLASALYCEWRIKAIEIQIQMLVTWSKEVERFDQEQSKYHQRAAAERFKLSYQLNCMLKKINVRMKRIDPSGEEISFFDESIEDRFANKKTIERKL